MNNMHLLPEDVRSDHTLYQFTLYHSESSSVIDFRAERQSHPNDVKATKDKPGHYEGEWVDVTPIPKHKVHKSTNDQIAKAEALLAMLMEGMS